MNSNRAIPRVAVVLSGCAVVIGIVGFVVALILNALFFDKFDAYGEVPIPGSGSVELPAGEVSVSFHTWVTDSEGGLPVPALELHVQAPPGAAMPTVTESPGATTTVNNDAHVRVWMMQVAEPAVYQVRVDGDVRGYINPRLAFGYPSRHWWLVWMFAGVFAASLAALAASAMWLRRAERRPRFLGSGERFEPVEAVELGEHTINIGGPSERGYSYQPTDHAIRIEQLKTIAALRDSGALTQEEFEAEKRRILDS